MNNLKMFDYHEFFMYGIHSVRCQNLCLGLWNMIWSIAVVSRRETTLLSLDTALYIYIYFEAQDIVESKESCIWWILLLSNILWQNGIYIIHYNGISHWSNNIYTLWYVTWDILMFRKFYLSYLNAQHNIFELWLVSRSI